MFYDMHTNFLELAGIVLYQSCDTSMISLKVCKLGKAEDFPIIERNDSL